MGRDTDAEGEECFFDILKEDCDDTCHEQCADGEMQRVEELMIIDSQPGEQEGEFCQIWEECTDDDQGDILFRGSASDPSDEGVGEPVSHVVSSVRSGGCRC